MLKIGNSNALGASAPLRVLFASAEFSPLTRESCIAAFTASISNALRALGHDVRAVIPLHRCNGTGFFDVRKPICTLEVPILGSTSRATVFEVDGPGGMPILAIENDRYFGQADARDRPDDDECYVFFSKAIVELLDEMEWQPDVVHCVEWHTALVTDYLQGATGLEDTDTPISVLTVCELERYTPTTLPGRRLMDSPQLTLNLAARGVLTADVVTVDADASSRAVSRLELLTPFFRERGWQVTCVETPTGTPYKPTETLRAGFEGHWDSMTDPAIHTAFGPASVHRKSRNKQALQLVRGLSVEADVPLIGMVCPLDDAHGITHVLDILDALAELGAQFVAHGRGEERYEQLFARTAEASPLSMSFRLESPDAARTSSRRLFAASDMFLAPGCEHPGLQGALRYGAIPIASCPRGGTPKSHIGFQFDSDVPGSLLESLRVAIEQYRTRETWSALVQRALLTDPHWQDAANRYELLYRMALRIPGGATSRRAGHPVNSEEMRVF